MGNYKGDLVCACIIHRSGRRVTLTFEIIPVIFNIHVEPDDRLIAFKRKRWLGYENLHEYLMNARGSFEKSTGKKVCYNWLFRLDYQIKEVYGDPGWALKEYSSLIRESLENGDELGVHIHSWRKHNRLLFRTWLADFSNEDWPLECLYLAHKTFISHFKRKPSFFTFGDHYMTDSFLGHLECLGYRADLSAWPGRPNIDRFVKHELSRGFLPSFEGVPRRPFKPKSSEGNSRGIWEIPVSVASSWCGDNNYPDKLLLGMPFGKARQIIEDSLNDLPEPYLFAEMRTDVRMDEFNRSQFEEILDYLVQHPVRKKMQLMQVSHFIDVLEKNYCRQDIEDSQAI